MVAHEAQVMVRGLNHYPDAAKALNKDLFFSLSNHALIIVSKFLEVWEDSSGLIKSEPRIIPTRKALTPFIDRIMVWKGIRSLRNSALAHAYLDKDGELTTPWQQLSAGAAPSYHAEIVLLLQLVYLSVLTILAIFEKEFVGIESLCGPGANEQPAAGPGISGGSEIQNALRPIAKSVEERLWKGFGIRVQGALLESFIRATRPNAMEPAITDSDAEPSDAEHRRWILMLYQLAHSDIRWAKEQAWQVGIWSFALFAAILALYKEPLSRAPVWPFWVMVLAVVFPAIWFLFRLHWFAIEARTKSDRIEAEMSGRTKTILPKRSRDANHASYLWIQVVCLAIAAGISIVALRWIHASIP